MRVTWQSTGLFGCFYSESIAGTDFRGSGRQVIDSPGLRAVGVEFRAEEAFVVTSLPRVLRGMHAQRAPYDHAKLVTCLTGEVYDVLWDGRLESPTFGQTLVSRLSAANGARLYIAPGVFHGFCVEGDDSASMLIQVSSPHLPSASIGLHWAGFGHNWPICSPIVSERDAALPSRDALLRSLP